MKISDLKIGETVVAKSSEVQDILMALNSSGGMGFKYPIGNKELTEKVKKLESEKKIKYDEHHAKWVKAGKFKEMSMDDDALEKASELGSKAFQEGKKAVPAHDKHLMDLIKHEGEGSAMPLMKAWEKSWHKANLA